MEQVLPIAPIDLRGRLRHVIERPSVQQAIIGLILLNATLLGLETSSGIMSTRGGLIAGLDAYPRQTSAGALPRYPAACCKILA